MQVDGGRRRIGRVWTQIIGAVLLVVISGFTAAQPTAAATACEPRCAPVDGERTHVPHMASFTDAGSTVRYIVPENVTKLVVVAVGGNGGDGGHTRTPARTVHRAAGASAAALLDVTPGDELWLMPGGSGGDAGELKDDTGSGGRSAFASGRDGGTGAGATAGTDGTAGGGGGGASAVVAASGKLVVVAAGGGGGGGDGGLDAGLEHFGYGGFGADASQPATGLVPPGWQAVMPGQTGTGHRAGPGGELVTADTKLYDGDVFLDTPGANATSGKSGGGGGGGGGGAPTGWVIDGRGGGNEFFPDVDPETHSFCNAASACPVLPPGGGGGGGAAGKSYATEQYSIDDDGAIDFGTTAICCPVSDQPGIYVGTLGPTNIPLAPPFDYALNDDTPGNATRHWAQLTCVPGQFQTLDVPAGAVNVSFVAQGGKGGRGGNTDYGHVGGTGGGGDTLLGSLPDAPQGYSILASIGCDGGNGSDTDKDGFGAGGWSQFTGIEGGRGSLTGRGGGGGGGATGLAMVGGDQFLIAAGGGGGGGGGTYVTGGGGDGGNGGFGSEAGDSSFCHCADSGGAAMGGADNSDAFGLNAATSSSAGGGGGGGGGQLAGGGGDGGKLVGIPEGGGGGGGGASWASAIVTNLVRSTYHPTLGGSLVVSWDIPVDTATDLVIPATTPVDQPVTMTATVTVAGTTTPASAGQLVFIVDNGRPPVHIVPGVAGPNGTFTGQISGLRVGAHSATASFAPDDPDLVHGSTSVNVSFTVTAVPSTTTLTADDPATVTAPVGTPLDATATVAASLFPQGLVQLTMDGVPVNPTATSTGTTSQAAQLAVGADLPVGTHQLVATYVPKAGFTDVTGSQSTVLTIVRTAIATHTTVTVAPTNDLHAGDAVTATVTVTPDPAPPGLTTPLAGTIELSRDGTAIATQNVTATAVGEPAVFDLAGIVLADLDPTTLTATFTPTTATYTASASIDDDGAGTTVTAGPGQSAVAAHATTTDGVTFQAPITVGRPVDLVAVVSTLNPAAVLPTPSGDVAFTVDGNPAGSATLTDGTARLAAGQTAAAIEAATTGPPLSVGTHTITATYAGDTNHLGATTTFTIDVVKAPSVTTATYDPATTTVRATVAAADPTLTLSRPSGTVDLQLDGAVVATASVVDGAVSFTGLTLAPGDHTFAVSYSGSGELQPSTAAPIGATVANPTEPPPAQLPTTGSNATLIVTAATIAALAGIALVVTARRRHRRLPR